MDFIQKSNWHLRVITGVFILSFVRVAFPVKVEIVQEGGGWQLLRDGEPYHINGGGSDPINFCYDVIVNRGGNAIRTWWPAGDAVARAEELGLTVCLGLGDLNPDAVRNVVNQYKNSPAILMWGLGNEIETRSGTDAWYGVNEAAKAAKSVDPDHPCITVCGGGVFSNHLNVIKQVCTDLDALGLNYYGDLSRARRYLQDYGWTKPVIITEFGTVGHWEAPKNFWGTLIEPSSTEKARLYLTGINAIVKDNPQCLGSFAFLWGFKQEKTHTWYSMFLSDSTAMNPVDVIAYSWTGQWHENLCPRIGPLKVQAGAVGCAGVGNNQQYFRPGSIIECFVDTDDPENDAPDILWEIRPDETMNPSWGGAREPPTFPIEGSVLSQTGKHATLRIPSQSRNYIIHVYVFDGKRSAGYASLSIRVDGGAPVPSDQCDVRADVEVSTFMGTAPCTIVFDGAGSRGRELDYSWDFGDGETANDVIAEHTFEQEGEYTVTLRVSSGGSSDEESVLIRVVDSADVPLSLNGRAFASVDQHDPIPPKNVTDANPETQWESGGNEGEKWIFVDLGDERSITTAVLSWGDDYSINYSLQISSDQLAWEEIYSESDGDGGEDVCEMTGNGRYVRLVSNRSTAQSGNIVIKSFDVYGYQTGSRRLHVTGGQASAAEYFDPALRALVLGQPALTGARISVYDVQGRLVMAKNVPAQSRLVNVDLPGSGTYIYRFNPGNRAQYAQNIFLIK